MCCGSSMGDCLLLRLIGVILAFSAVVSSDMVLVVRETGDLQVTPNLKVKGSPGLNQEITSLCERIHIIGVTRFQHMNMYAHSVKLIVKASTAGADIHVCSHRNVSIPIGMCPHYQWEKVSNGSWIQKMIPLDHKILDVRIASSSKLTLQVSTVQEWFIYRIVFLILGTVLLSSASRLSRSLEFYYTSAFSGYIFLGLLILFQLMKHLPTGQSSRSLFLYSSLVGLVGVFIPYIPADWYLNTITALGYKKGILYHQLFNLYMVGVITGVCSFEALVLTQDGSIDISTSHFFSWSIWILGVLLILQSSVDPLLAGGALLSVFVMLSMLKKITRLIFPLDQRNRLNKILLATNERLVNAKTDMEDLIARLNQEIAVKDYLNKKMQWDMEELRQKSYEMEMKLKSREDGSSHAEPTEQSKDELDARKQQLEDLSRRYDELEAKSKADIEVLVKEVKSLRRSHVELEKKLTQSLTDKTEAEKLLQQERKLLENTVAARKKLLSDCIILHDRLKEYNLNLDSEVSDNL